MDISSATDAVNEEHLPVEETDDFCRIDFIEIVPLTRDTDGSCTAECVSGDWSAEVKQKNFSDVKQEPDDYKSSAMCSVRNDAVPTEVSETQSHMEPVVLETLDLARLQKKNHIWTNRGESLTEVNDDMKNEADITEHPPKSQPFEIKIEADDGGDNSKPYLCTLCGERFAEKDSLNSHRQFCIEGSSYVCTQCDKRLSCRVSLAHHKNIHTDKYKCSECGKRCCDKRHLAVHKRSHSGEKPFVCTTCGRRFTVLSVLIAHGRIHSGEKPHKCRVCDRAFRERRELTVHMRVHTGDQPYRCSLCNKNFSRSSYLQQHECLTHCIRGRFLCPYCGKLYQSNSKLDVHVRIHTGAKPYSCRHCSDRFMWDWQLKRHLLKSHDEGKSTFEADVTEHPRDDTTGENLFSCNECEKYFTSHDDLYRHMNIHTDNYKCRLCGKRFQSSQDLVVHRQSHSARKPLECTVCGKIFTRLRNLVVHNRLHSGEKPYKCRVCDKAFVSSGKLSLHMRVHTRDKPHKCSLCNTGFSAFSSLQEHKLCVHSNEGLYYCPYCEKLFKTKKGLEYHIRIHTGEKLYSCGHCSDRFTWHKQLKRHLLKSHNEGKRSANEKTEAADKPRPYACAECDEQFIHKKQLSTHRKGHRTYRCPHCEKLFESAKERDLHVFVFKLVKSC